jgi:uroporphyrinogen decarboxylase
MAALQNDRLIRALQRQPLEATPVWMMRQAGRYLPEYRATRTKAGNFLQLCQNPELACEVTLQPLERYPLDAAILFSDILTIPDAMGLGLYFSEGEGPVFEHPIKSIKDIQQLPIPDPNQDLAYVMDAVALIRQQLAGRVPLIGFAGSPWTLATYMVEGGSSKNFSKIKALLYEQPQAAQELLNKLSSAVSLYLQAQIQAGAQVIMLFDTWGGVLTQRDYLTYSLSYMQKIVTELSNKYPTVPIILFTKGGGLWLEAMADSGCQALGVDWTMPLDIARQKVGHKVALQGNMDPCILYAKPERIVQEVQEILAAYGKGSGHVFNLGHGIHPEVNPEHVAVFIEAVHKYSPAYHV